MKTTVEWLEHMLLIILNKEEFKKITYAIEQAKEMEKQQQGYSEEEVKQETLEEVELAVLFHNTYEKLAPSFGYETRLDTKLFDTTTPNGKLMIAVCKEVIKWQQKRSYSEEEVEAIAKQAYGMGRSNYTIKAFNEWFEQFKNK